MTGHDAIVVGARCAGAPLAMLLARRGHRVVLVDRATLPSDTLSTLVIQPAGVAALARMELLDQVTSTGCPAIERFSFDFGPVVIAGRPRDAAGERGAGTAYAPRRVLLDGILVEAAARAGVEVRPRFTVDELVFDGDAVVGIRGHDRAGASVTERARVVVGADGWNSVVARAVGAQAYHAKPVLEHAFYAFWPDLPVDGMTVHIRGDRGIATVPTNDGHTLVLVGCPVVQAGEFRHDVEGHYHAALQRVPELADRLVGTAPIGRIVGGGVPNFFRPTHGRGWALVGDAAYTKDPITAQGISDALVGAEGMADALHRTWEGDPAALASLRHARDDAALSMYEFTTQLATLEPPPPEVQQLLAAIEGNQSAMDDFVSVACGTLQPADFFDPANLAALPGR